MLSESVEKVSGTVPLRVALVELRLTQSKFALLSMEILDTFCRDRDAESKCQDERRRGSRDESHGSPLFISQSRGA